MFQHFVVQIDNYGSGFVNTVYTRVLAERKTLKKKDKIVGSAYTRITNNYFSSISNSREKLTNQSSAMAAPIVLVQ